MKLGPKLDLKTALRCVLAALLISAALTKIANPGDFLTSLSDYKLPLPDSLVRLTAHALPWAELLCGILLLTRSLRRAALLCSMILFTVFALVTGQAWVRGIETGCGCFNLSFLGIGESRGAALGGFFESVKFAFFRALLLLAWAVWLLRSDGKVRARDETVAG
jgi:uncharacterized membrane protein YphA (DoxX/SURF4 family)